MPLMTERMVEALEIEDKHHEVHWYDDEAHGWERRENRRDAWNRIVAFLRVHALGKPRDRLTVAGPDRAAGSGGSRDHADRTVGLEHREADIVDGRHAVDRSAASSSVRSIEARPRADGRIRPPLISRTGSPSRIRPRVAFRWMTVFSGDRG